MTFVWLVGVRTRIPPYCTTRLNMHRVVKRDIAERGRDIKGVLEQYEKFVKPAFDDHILPVSTNRTRLSTTLSTHRIDDRRRRTPILSSPAVSPTKVSLISFAITLLKRHVQWQSIWSRNTSNNSCYNEAGSLLTWRPRPNSINCRPPCMSWRATNKSIRFTPSFETKKSHGKFDFLSMLSLGPMY